jgi:predicted nucleic acid-binding protein
MIIVDTNILIDVLQDDPKWADWSIQQLQAQSQVHELVINPIIYAELSAVFESRTALDKVIADMRLLVHELPLDALFLAGKAFLRYKRSGGNKQNVLPDFS